MIFGAVNNFPGEKVDVPACTTTNKRKIQALKIQTSWGFFFAGENIEAKEPENGQTGNALRIN